MSTNQGEVRFTISREIVTHMGRRSVLSGDNLEELRNGIESGSISAEDTLPNDLIGLSIAGFKIQLGTATALIKIETGFSLINASGLIIRMKVKIAAGPIPFSNNASPITDEEEIELFRDKKLKKEKIPSIIESVANEANEYLNQLEARFLNESLALYATQNGKKDDEKIKQKSKETKRDSGWIMGLICCFIASGVYDGHHYGVPFLFLFMATLSIRSLRQLIYRVLSKYAFKRILHSKSHQKLAPVPKKETTPPPEWEITLNQLKANPALTNSISEKGVTPLLKAICKYPIEAIKQMIEMGAGVNMSDDDGTTPLMIAAIRGDKAIAKLLIQSGADINVADRFYHSPLLLAVKTGHKDISKLLFQNGAFPFGLTSEQIEKYCFYDSDFDLMHDLMKEVVNSSGGEIINIYPPDPSDRKLCLYNVVFKFGTYSFATTFNEGNKILLWLLSDEEDESESIEFTEVLYFGEYKNNKKKAVATAIRRFGKWIGKKPVTFDGDLEDLLHKYMKEERSKSKSKDHSGPQADTDSQEESSTSDWTEVLGLARDCTETEIKDAFRRLAKEAHPDKASNKDEENQDAANKKMQELNEAYKNALKEKRAA